MSPGTVRVSSLFVAGAYFFLFMLVAWPMIDLLSNTWPLQPGNIQWRFGFMGLLTAFLHTPFLGILLGMALAYTLNHKTTLRILSALCIVAVVLLFIVIVAFALDAIQLRSVTPEENRSMFQAGILLTELKYATALLMSLLVGWGGWKTAGTMFGSGRSTGGSELTAEVIKAQKRD